MSQELKPCPFCGGSAFITSARTAHCNYKACCNECTATLSNSSRAALIEEWNKRHSPWRKIEFLDDLPIETDLLFHNGIDTFQSWVNVCMDTGANYIVDNEEATHWMPLPEAPEVQP
ncbi:Lar family restriction alleviation protein [Endozoicomonas acroporae]|uniref:Lar family restriction alleviation protein n=1 Tax=Endozoicomonas acroporae TaxID=1701104 RepID=UPI003D7AB4F4